MNREVMIWDRTPVTLNLPGNGKVDPCDSKTILLNWPLKNSLQSSWMVDGIKLKPIVIFKYLYLFTFAQRSKISFWHNCSYPSQNEVKGWVGGRRIDKDEIKLWLQTVWYIWICVICPWELCFGGHSSCISNRFC